MAQMNTASPTVDLIPRDQKGGSAIPRDQRSEIATADEDQKGGSVIPRDQRSTFRIEVRMRAKYLDVEQILANWRVERKQAPKLAEAIRLMNAIETGNLHYVRENYPIMAAAFQRPAKPQKRHRPPSYIESESLREDSDLEDSKKRGMEALEQAIEEVTGVDRRLNLRVAKLARRLHELNYSADDVRQWYSRCWRMEWPGNKGELPDLKDLQERIGRIRTLAPLPTDPLPDNDRPPAAPALPVADLPAVNAQSDERYQAEWERLNCPDCSRARDVCVCQAKATLPNSAVNWWEGTLGQLQVQLARATYDTWLRHIELIEFSPGKLVAEVPHHYAASWINAHLLPAMTKTFNNMYEPGKRGQPEVMIEVRARPEPVEPEIQQERG